MLSQRASTAKTFWRWKGGTTCLWRCRTCRGGFFGRVDGTALIASFKLLGMSALHDLTNFFCELSGG